MDELELASTFDRQRPQLRAVAYRILGSVSEADDALQDAWLRLQAGGLNVDLAAGQPAVEDQKRLIRRALQFLSRAPRLHIAPAAVRNQSRDRPNDHGQQADPEQRHQDPASGSDSFVKSSKT